MDEEAGEALVGKESRQTGHQRRPTGRLQHWSLDLAAEDRHLVAQ
ncbi:MAG: hypothetical protein M0Z47_09330 [Actinomycetota bacterium]|nr:hypothetical protein [Actinomycetota bacterium]